MKSALIVSIVLFITLMSFVLLFASTPADAEGSVGLDILEDEPTHKFTRPSKQQQEQEQEASESRSEVEDEALPSAAPSTTSDGRPARIGIKVRHEDDMIPDPEEHPDMTHNIVATPDLGMDPHEAMRCHVCRHAVAPTIVKACETQAGKVDSKELIDTELRKLAHLHTYDMESKTAVMRENPEEIKFTDEERDENIHNFIEHMLYDEFMASTLYALPDVYVQQPTRRHWFPRLVDHAICPCHDGKEIYRLDHGLDKYLMNHVAATIEAQKRYNLDHDELKAKDFIEENINKLDMDSHEEDESEEDAQKRKKGGSTRVGQVWVHGQDGDLDGVEQSSHDMESQTVLHEEGAHDDEGAGAYNLGEEATSQGADL